MTGNASSPLSPTTPADGAGGQGPPVASVIVPARQWDGRLEACLEALRRQDLAEAFEVVVVLADGPPPVQVASRFPKVRFRRSALESGPGGARNRGIEAARGEYLAFTDADCLPAPDWLRLLLEACRRNQGRPVRGWVDAGNASRTNRAMNLAEQGTPSPKRPRRVPGLTGANTILSRRLLDAGGARFGEGLYGGEESALLRGLPNQGQPILLEPAARVRHMRSDTFRQSLDRMYALGFGAGRIRRRGRLRGRAFARHPWLAALLVPARLLLLTGRAIKCPPAAVLELVRLFPLILLQVIWYSAGFAAGCRPGTPDRAQPTGRNQP